MGHLSWFGLFCHVLYCLVALPFSGRTCLCVFFQQIFWRHLWACATKARFQSNSLPLLFHLLSVPGAGDYMIVIEDCGSTGWAGECIYNRHLYVSIFLFLNGRFFSSSHTFNFVLSVGNAGATCQAEGDGTEGGAGLCFTGGASSPMVRTVFDKYKFEATSRLTH